MTMVKSKKFTYIVESTLANGEECKSYEKDINDAMLVVGRMAKRGIVVHKVTAIITTVEEEVVLDFDEWRESN